MIFINERPPNFTEHHYGGSRNGEAQLEGVLRSFDAA